MCRNIRTLHHFDPPTTEEEVHASALQYVRKVSGLAKAPATPASALAFDTAVRAVAEATSTLLASLPTRGVPRTREQELLRARERFLKRAR